MTSKSDRIDAAKAADRNADPITDEAGAHPVGVGIGAAAGGAAVGAAAGAVAGPVGAVVGAVAGAVAGGYAGKGVAESIDPTLEDAYWRENYQSRPYYDSTVEYNRYAPAYRYGWESQSKYVDKSFAEVEPELASGWSQVQGGSGLPWTSAKGAAQDAWDRVQQRKHRK